MSYQKKKYLFHTLLSIKVWQPHNFFKKLIIHMPCLILSKFARPRETHVSK